MFPVTSVSSASSAVKTKSMHTVSLSAGVHSTVGQSGIATVVGAMVLVTAVLVPAAVVPFTVVPATVAARHW